MREVILAKYGEIVLKGLNRSYFESILLKNVKNALESIGNFSFESIQSTLYITEESDDIEMPFTESKINLALERLKKVFGIVSLSVAVSAPKDIEEIKKKAVEYLSGKFDSFKTFKVEAKRSDKSFPLKSPEICNEVGGYILSHFPKLKVDVHNPDLILYVEVRDKSAYIHAGNEPGAGGMPVGTSGKGTLLLSGGIDSPVAGYLMARRGLSLTAVYFSTPPYTSDRATDKVIRLAREVSKYAGPFNLYVVPFTDIQMEINKSCPQELFTIVMRRYMMKIAEKISRKTGSGALITGESLAQVASQTLSAITVTNASVSLPVLRPLIGMDKEDIVKISRKIGTFDISIEPYEDCCSLFSPRHPKIKPTLNEVLSAEEKIKADDLLEIAIKSSKIIKIEG